MKPRNHRYLLEVEIIDLMSNKVINPVTYAFKTNIKIVDINSNRFMAYLESLRLIIQPNFDIKIGIRYKSLVKI